jgi:hypothetical protein
MIPAVLIGREGSVGFPGKNFYPVLGRPLMSYPLLTALHTRSVDEVYVSTDSEKIKDISRKHKAKIIDRPDYLCTNEALGEDAFVHAYKHIKDTLKNDVELVVLLFCNAPCLLPSMIEEGIKVLRENPEYDSAVTVSTYNMFSPIRARKTGKDGLLYPFIPFDKYDKNMRINCDRDSQGDVLFADMSISIVRPRCLDDLDYGILPQRWMGKKIYPIKNWGALDVDFEWQIPQVEFWLKKQGFTKDKLPY